MPSQSKNLNPKIARYQINRDKLTKNVVNKHKNKLMQNLTTNEIKTNFAILVNQSENRQSKHQECGTPYDVCPCPRLSLFAH